MRSIAQILEPDLPKVDGLIGRPPWQSWSEAGSHRGIYDQRGQLFFEYIRVLKHVQPKFFLAENVSGILSSPHRGAAETILEQLRSLGYNVKHKMLRASASDAPQERDRVIVVGTCEDIGCRFEFPNPVGAALTLREAIGKMPAPKVNNWRSARINTARSLRVGRRSWKVVQTMCSQSLACRSELRMSN